MNQKSVILYAQTPELQYKAAYTPAVEIPHFDTANYSEFQQTVWNGASHKSVRGMSYDHLRARQEMG